MSTWFQASALNSVQRYFKAVLVRFRRFVNSAVANMLATHEQQATLFGLKKSALVGLIVAGSLPSTLTRAGEPVVRSAYSLSAVPTHPDSLGVTHSADASSLTAPGEATRNRQRQ